MALPTWSGAPAGCRLIDGGPFLIAELVFVAGLSVAHGMVAGAEAAIVSTKPSRLRELEAGGDEDARRVRLLREAPERFLAATRAASSALAAVTGVVGGLVLERAFYRACLSATLVSSCPSLVAVLGTVTVVGVLLATVGTVVPQSLALDAPERVALRAAKAMTALTTMMAPLAWLSTKVSNAFLLPLSKRATFAAPDPSEETLHQMVDEAAKTGALDPRAGDIAARALDFGKLTAEDVMVPRTDVVALSVHQSLGDLQSSLLESGHSRLPVYDRSVDEILGYVSAKDVLALTVERALFVMQDLVRPALFVPVSMRAPEVLHQLQMRCVHMAFVTDAEGGLAGIVTMEDLLEELVGQIFSEHDGKVTDPMQVVEAGTLVVDGTVPVREVNRELAVELPESDQWSTVAGLCIALAGHIPRTGEHLQVDDGTTLEILDASNRRVRSVRVRRP